jgi:hypothetical protein
MKFLIVQLPPFSVTSSAVGTPVRITDMFFVHVRASLQILLQVASLLSECGLGCGGERHNQNILRAATWRVHGAVHNLISSRRVQCSCVVLPVSGFRRLSQ